MRIADSSFRKVKESVGVNVLYSRSHDAVIRVCDTAGNVLETHDHVGDLKEW